MHNRIFIYLWCVCFFVSIACDAYSQVFISESSYEQEVRVGLVDEFLKRFNGESFHPVVSSQDNRRKSTLLFLVDIPSNTVNRDSLFDETVKFVDAIIKDSICLRYSDSLWVAHATCKGLLEGKKVSFDVYLNVEHRTDDMYKWVISKVDGACFDIAPKDVTNNIMFYPDDHEIKFMSLGRMTKEQPFNVSRFMSKMFEYDATSAFVYLVRSGKLKIEYVDELEFIFTQVPNYIFTIRYFEREGVKSGWLIDRFETMSQDDKRKFLSSLNIECTGQTAAIGADSRKPVIDEKEIHVDSNCCAALHEIGEKFVSRVAERKALLMDYLLLLKVSDKKDEVKSYQKKILDLFDSNSCAYMYCKDKGKTVKCSLPNFLGKVSSHKVDFISVDKIVVPIWEQDRMITDTCEEIQLGCKIEHFTVDPSSELKGSDQIVVARKEQTENGIEWMPYLGHLYVTVK